MVHGYEVHSISYRCQESADLLGGTTLVFALDYRSHSGLMISVSVTRLFTC